MEFQNARSLRSEQRCYVRFYNVTERTVELTWINFNGQYVRYQILNKGNYVDVTTYKTHPWIAKDILTKDSLHIDKNFVYYPKTTREFISEHYPERAIPQHHEARVRAYITLPIHTLERKRTLIEDYVEKLSRSTAWVPLRAVFIVVSQSSCLPSPISYISQGTTMNTALISHISDVLEPKLRYTALLCVRNYILEAADVNSLNLPQKLSERLKRVVVKRNRECAMQAVSAGPL